MLEKNSVLEMIRKDENLSSILKEETGVDFVTKAIMENKEQDGSIDQYFYDMAESFIKVMLYYIQTLESEDAQKISNCLKLLKENNKQELKEIIKKSLGFENKGSMLCDSVFLNTDQSFDTIMQITIDKFESVL